MMMRMRMRMPLSLSSTLMRSMRCAAPSMALNVPSPSSSAFRMLSVKARSGPVAKSNSSDSNNVTDTARLVAAIQSEIEHEDHEAGKLSADDSDTPPALRKLLEQRDFKIRDVPGESDVVLTRDIKTAAGDERITVTFSVDDVENAEYISPEDDSYGDEENAATTINQSGEEEELRIPVNTIIAITKPTTGTGDDAGAVVFQAVAEDGSFVISNVSYVSDSSLANAATADAEFRRQGSYLGPSYETLDDALRERLDDYLAARGIDDELAEGLPLYIKRKEQLEYRNWLTNLKRFMSSK